MDEERKSWLANSDAVTLLKDTREYTLRQMNELEGMSFPRVIPHPSAPLSALKHNLRSLRAEMNNQAIKRVASNSLLLMGFSVFEYSLSQSLQVFLGARAKPGRELSFSESKLYLEGINEMTILSSDEWKLMASVQEIRHAIAHRGSVIELADEKYQKYPEELCSHIVTAFL